MGHPKPGSSKKHEGNPLAEVIAKLQGKVTGKTQQEGEQDTNSPPIPHRNPVVQAMAKLQGKAQSTKHQES